MLNPDIIIPFDGNHADIPSGFTRETSLDGKFPKAWGTQDPNVTGGSATHTHTSPAHSHAIVSHTHTVTTADATTADYSSDDAGSGSGTRTNHNHGSKASSTTSGGTLSDAITYQAVSSNPAYYEVIFIKSSGYSFIPVNGIILGTGTTRESLTFHSASANKFLRGAGTGEDAGGTGGTYNHEHSVSHTHSAVNHYHTGTTNNSDSGDADASGSTAQVTYFPHSHTYTTANRSLAGSAYSGNAGSADTVQPAFRTLNAFKNESANPILPQVGDIAMFLGTEAQVPIGWVACNGSNGTSDMRNRFLKIPSAASATTTGGSNTHTHAASNSHTHGSSVHSHTSGYTNYVDSSVITGVGSKAGLGKHRHTITIANATATWVSSTISASSADAQPEYRTVIYIQMKFSAMGGASFFMNLL